jgi:hypothetical protein
MKGYWDHKGKPSMFVVKDGDKEIYRGGFKKGYELLMNTEPKNDTIEYLRKYNEWRRGADTEQPDPKELGEQIDAAIAGLTMLEETAKLAATLKVERDEAREALKEIEEYGTEEINDAVELRQKLATALVERDEAREVASGLAVQEERVEEAQKELSSIHRWIERNHPDGVIDSLSYLRNLERVGDRWYDRLDIVERERDEARAALENNSKATEMLERMAYEERAKDARLLNISERAINALTSEWGYAEATKILRAQFDQLKEGEE